MIAGATVLSGQATSQIILYIGLNAALEAASKDVEVIPKIIHYVWVGGPLPDYQREFVESWRLTNPTYELRLWNEDNIDFSAPMLREAYERRRWSQVADIVRLMAVVECGGIYFDTDVKVLASLDTVLTHKCFYGFQTQSRSAEWIGNAAFGAEPQNPFLRNALDRLLAMEQPPSHAYRPTTYGPRHITNMLFECGLKSYSPEGVQVGDVFIYPTHVFYPYHWKEHLTPDKIKPDTLGIHVWAKTPSWEQDLHPVMRFARSSRLFARRLLTGS